MLTPFSLSSGDKTSPATGAFLTPSKHEKFLSQWLNSTFHSRFIPSLTQSMVKARDAITKANAGGDKDQERSALHFDGKNFQGGQDRPTDNTVSALQGNDASQGRSLLGQVLHTVQDFYSHRCVRDISTKY